MSERIVILGPHDGKKMQAAEIPPMDAGAFLNGDRWRVSLTLYSEPLHNATVIGPNPIDRPISQGDWNAHLAICPQAIPFEIALPIHAAAYGASRAGHSHEAALTFTAAAAEIDEATRRFAAGKDAMASWAELERDDRDKIVLGIHDQILDTIAARIYALRLLARDPASA